MAKRHYRRTRPSALKRALGRPKPPAKITQPAYDCSPRVLRHIANPDRPTNLTELAAYLDGYRYLAVEEVQPELAAWALPQLLEVWACTLLAEPLPDHLTGEWHERPHSTSAAQTTQAMNGCCSMANL